MMNSGSGKKIHTSTQVEYNFVEARNIIGQEDLTVENLSKDVSSLNLRKQYKGIRPPLVGQASSSSNDSVSLPFEAKCLVITPDRPLPSPTQNLELNQGNDSLDHRKRLSYLPNRNDYINQKSHEGSYCHLYMSSQPAENNPDFTRVRSSSSASSVTSNRRLEWDNGADLGYNQSHVTSGIILDPNISTVERMALVSSTKLLRRSDPEGTTGGNFQQIQNPTLSQMSVQNKFGHPNAESTPLCTNVVSDTSPDTGDFISPIPFEGKEYSEPEIISSESEASGKNNIPDKSSKNEPSLNYVNEAIKQKVPLFPEMLLGNFNPNKIGNCEMSRALDENGCIDVPSNDDGLPKTAEIQSVICNNNEIDIKMQNFNDELQRKLNSINGLDVVHKKLSSSLENLANSNNITSSSDKNIPSTLPRSQSQTDLYLEKVSYENVTNGKESKANLVIQNLFKNKSASSSSVATVVHKKGDSPKHAVVQTSILKKQSVGTQVCESIDRNIIKSKVVAVSAFAETPHLPKPALTHQPMKKSNYFDFNEDPNKFKKASIDLSVLAPNANFLQKEARLSGPHFHNGILCKGAHKKQLTDIEFQGHSNQFSTNFMNSNRPSCGLDNNVPVPFTNKNQPQSIVSSSNFNQKKNCANMIDSVESSVKSGGCGTDQQYSVTVEDRVNSFEYLPGHVYENNERQPINSCGTSSMSIENQTSNNVTPDGQKKIWESSDEGSISSTFENDAQRGVDILSDFAKGAYENDTLLKRKLIRRVVDKLISKNHIDKKVELSQDLMKNRPWVPPRPSNPVKRNAINTCKSKVPCEFSSHSEKSGTTNTSSECFIPKPANGNKCFPSFFQDDSPQKCQGEVSSTSNVTPENSAKPVDTSPKSHKFIDSNIHKTRKKHISKQNEDFQTNQVLRTNNWKEPATKTEKLIEERRKLQNESSSSHSSVSQLLDMERENQLFWIRSEIEHLSNLKLLLERQEKLKQGLKKCKSRQNMPSEKNVLKENNRLEKDKTRTACTGTDTVGKKSSLKSKSSHPLKLNEWLKAASKSQDTDLEGWASHQYEKDENIKSCMKRKSKYQTQPSQTRTSTTDKDYVLYDEPPTSFQKRKHAINDNPNESSFNDDTECNRMNLANSGPPSAGDRGVERQTKARESGCQCGCRGKCRCCATHTDAVDDRKKAPLGYYIIFDDHKKTNDPSMPKNQVDEIGISRSMGERKQKVERRSRVERQRAGADNVDERRADLVRKLDTEPTSSDSDGGNHLMNLENKKPIFKGGAGELQYNLLQNHPSYVSRAEDRRQCIAQMQYLRELSSQNKQRLLSLTQPNPAPPPPMKVRRVFSQQKMRQMTEKKYRQLSEVREKIQDTKKKESYRTNRLMAEIFKKVRLILKRSTLKPLIRGM